MNKLQQEQILLSLGIKGLRKVSESKFECFCVDSNCGNSHGEKRRKAGFFWSSTGGYYVYHCFKCGISKPLKYFLKDYYKEIYLQHFLISSESIEIPQNDFKVTDEKHGEFIRYLFDEKLIIPIEECKDKEVWDYIESRKIPKDKLKYLYYSENFHFISQELKELDSGDEQYNYKESDRRICWFFKNRTNEVVGLQGRAVGNGFPRYMIIRLKDDDIMIGGYENADFSKRLYVVEGYIDSLFLPNAISLNGLHLPTIKHLLEKVKVPELTVIFDNEPLNIQIKKNIDSLVELSHRYEGLKVCLLPKEMRSIGKDINDYIKSGLSSEELIGIINNNSYSRNMLKVQSTFWN